jgi:hypothetical protein
MSTQHTGHVGVMKLRCNPSTSAQTRHVVHTAIRVGTLHVQLPS